MSHNGIFYKIHTELFRHFCRFVAISLRITEKRYGMAAGIKENNHIATNEKEIPQVI